MHVAGEDGAGVPFVVGVVDVAHVARKVGEPQNARFLVHHLVHLGVGHALLFADEGDGAGVDVAAAGTHYQPVHGREAHRRVMGLAVEHGRDRCAVADVAGDDLRVLEVEAREPGTGLCHVFVAGAVEAVLAYAVLVVIGVGRAYM